MLVFMILVPVTLLVIARYFIQFSAQWAKGGLQTLGKYLSLWVFALAGLLVVGAATAPMIGYGGPGMMRGFGPGFMMRRGYFPEDRFQSRVPPPATKRRLPPLRRTNHPRQHPDDHSAAACAGSAYVPQSEERGMNE